MGRGRVAAKLCGLAEGSIEAELSDRGALASSGLRLTTLRRCFNKPKQLLLLVLEASGTMHTSSRVIHV